MNELISNIEGIGQKFKERLEYVGIRTVSELLAKSQTQEDRDELSSSADIPVGYIDNWATMLDLTRVQGIGYQHAELLTYSGIKSVEDFRKRNPENLYDAMKVTNDSKHFTKTIPSSESLNKLIENAKKITNIVERY